MALIFIFYPGKGENMDFCPRRTVSLGMALRSSPPSGICKTKRSCGWVGNSIHRGGRNCCFRFYADLARSCSFYLFLSFRFTPHWGCPKRDSMVEKNTVLYTLLDNWGGGEGILESSNGDTRASLREWVAT